MSCSSWLYLVWKARKWRFLRKMARIFGPHIAQLLMEDANKLKETRP